VAGLGNQRVSQQSSADTEGISVHAASTIVVMKVILAVKLPTLKPRLIVMLSTISLL
jgi:hypothetical protein